MSDHTAKAYDAELEVITSKIAQMGGLCEAMLRDAIDALAKFDVGLAQRAISTDPRVDTLQREVEEQVVLTIARRQPMAVDLRNLVGAVRIAADLERIGDLAKNIAKRVVKMSDDPRLPRAVVGLRGMGNDTARQLKRVLDAFAKRDVKLADDVWASDAQIDAQEDVGFPRPSDLHDGRSARYLVLRPSPVLFEKFGTNRRSHHQHRRNNPFYRDRRVVTDGPSQR